MAKNEKPAAVERVLLVGHCGADTGMLHGVVSQALPGVAIGSAHSDEQLAKADGKSLLLINRVLEGGFRSGGGVELIAELAKRRDAPRLLLISNYPDAQDAARKAGALQGFGKSTAHTPEAARILRAAAGVE